MTDFLFLASHLIQNSPNKICYVKNNQKAAPNVVNVFSKNILKKGANEYIIYSVCDYIEHKKNIKGFIK